jgi:hypothetical protein
MSETIDLTEVEPSPSDGVLREMASQLATEFRTGSSRGRVGICLYMTGLLICAASAVVGVGWAVVQAFPHAVEWAASGLAENWREAREHPLQAAFLFGFALAVVGCWVASTEHKPIDEETV